MRGRPMPFTICCSRLGDLTRAEIDVRSDAGVAGPAIDELVKTRRALVVRIAGEERIIAVEDAARFRDAIGVPLPPGLPATLLEPVADPVVDLVRRFGRTHGPFTSKDVSARLGLGVAVIDAALQRLMSSGRVVDGEFRPGGRGREWCDAEVLRTVRQRSLARLRQEVEPVESTALGRFLVGWHSLAPAAIRARRLARRRRTAAGRPDRRVGARHRDPPRARSRLLTRDARHAVGRRRSDVDRRRTAWRSRRPHRALSHRSSRASCCHPKDALPAGSGVAAPMRVSSAAKRRWSLSSIATAHRFSVRCTKRRAAASPRRPSTPSGTWCGRDC